MDSRGAEKGVAKLGSLERYAPKPFMSNEIGPRLNSSMSQFRL